MSSENLHAPRERLSEHTLNLHFAIVSLMEELDAIDWYRQRADDAEEQTLKELLLHNMREEMEHAAMLLEWIRRHDGDFERFLKTYLFTEGSILQEEKAATAEGVGGESKRPSRAGSRCRLHDRLSARPLGDGLFEPQPLASARAHLGRDRQGRGRGGARSADRPPLSRSAGAVWRRA